MDNLIITTPVMIISRYDDGLFIWDMDNRVDLDRYHDLPEEVYRKGFRPGVLLTSRIRGADR